MLSRNPVPNRTADVGSAQSGLEPTVFNETDVEIKGVRWQGQITPQRVIPQQLKRRTPHLNPETLRERSARMQDTMAPDGRMEHVWVPRVAMGAAPSIEFREPDMGHVSTLSRQFSPYTMMTRRDACD